MRNRARYSSLLCGTAIAIVTMAAAPAFAEGQAINIEPQSLASALREFASQSQRAILVSPALADGKSSKGVHDATDPEIALAQLLQGTGLTWRRSGDALLIVSASDPQSGSAAGDGADSGTVQALVVTAQKREENIQDVPIAMSAFTQEDLTRSQVAGGPDLMTQVPNMTFTKTNFSSYSIQIRGIGTQAISATTDAAVAVAFNNTPFIRNRFFEQEFYDLQRVEVLRGPQGTLYGRNATAGVVNLISAKPKFTYEAKLSGDVGNYSSTRLEGMVNIPLVEDKVALRLAGAWTKRDGYDTNQVTGNQIDGRDLWSTRFSLRFSPNDRIDANLIWEHFQEDDDRLRSGKQLCKTHEITEVAGFPTTHEQSWPGSFQPLFQGIQGTFSQGCTPASLYSPDSFQTPNGLALPYYYPLQAVFLPAALTDPYVSRGQSHDLRVIESTVNPEYRAKSDVGEFQISFDLTDDLTLTSETAYSADTVFSLEDYNRFSTAPGAWDQPNPGGLTYREGVMTTGPYGGIFCDPQIGCSDRLVAVDLSTAKSRQFSQEFRLSSNFDGPFNFSLGANYLRSDSEDKYYVFINSLSIIAAISPYYVNLSEFPYYPGITDNSECLNGYQEPDYNVSQPILSCTYMDPNPIGSLNDMGHNYFLSRNPYKLISYAVFGESYYNITDKLKLTAGLRWTVDKKEAPLIPSWVLASNTVGLPVAEVVDQEWREPTGRLALDWKPDLSFTDETLVYASYAHGYKAGGANPPPYGVAVYTGGPGIVAQHNSAAKPKTFDPEFVNAYEIGAKNTLLDGRMTLNLAGFYYDYTGYQISQIIDRSAANMNFDADIWGLELEADWRPLENLRLGLKVGYENTKVADGEKAIDIMDRTAGTPGWAVVRPFPSIPSNCVLPVSLFVGNDPSTTGGSELVNVGGRGGGTPGPCELAWLFGYDPVTALPYNPTDHVTSGAGGTVGSHPNYQGFDPAAYPEANNGEGFYKDLSGNELPNAPHYTATLKADYTIPLPNDWLATLHTDLYYQSEAWTRIFNTEGYDKLKAYTNVNFAAIFTNEASGWNVMAYVKNVFDRDSITGAFLNSDDTGLTTNVFLTEPRLYGLRITKAWEGGPLLGGLTETRDHEGPYPITVAFGGQVTRFDAPKEAIAPGFLGSFADEINPLDAQGRDLDTGDEREVTLTYKPSADWSVSLGARFGKTKGKAYKAVTVDEDEGDTACLLAQYYCDLYPNYYFSNYADPKNWSQSSVYDKEEYTIVDFAVGRDVGMGTLGDAGSTVSLGLRYARLKSSGNVRIQGQPDWNFPAEYAFVYNSQSHIYDSHFDVAREFEGAGPVLSWTAAQALFGDPHAGHLDLDWSVSGGVLFGKQKTRIDGMIEDNYINHYYFAQPSPPLVVNLPRVPDETTVTDVAIDRSKSVHVPTLAVELGLSYKVQRINIGAGYRWERYFDVLDGGYAEHKSYDRTIDGPYFKIAVGFGG